MLHIQTSMSYLRYSPSILFMTHNITTWVWAVMTIVKIKKYTKGCREGTEPETKMSLFWGNFLHKMKPFEAEKQEGWIKGKKKKHP